METPHFAAAVTAFAAALEGHIDEGITSFPDLFHHDAVIDVPFDGTGDPPPIVGRPAIEKMAADLDGFLWFDEVTFHAVRATHDPEVTVCEYEAILRRADRDGRLRRRYVSVITLREGRIGHLREYGGPFVPTD
ncbi:nuclear transport factor 2 family protein [Rhodococcus sp. BP-349]|uniref:nuclear transport factor 2 family protein n=1 Tax=unclassified Rhodococcus (in: high G+C Gram-positive bacteria) TaxID=192944 RepID=UPI001C9AF080|nr:MULTISPECIES: nuclear transport factor 2 family protein [unclassified Rhodococcus (in: high G+C Gram-positive bacteria)]MBY6537885.1 nuclear transport factor 2 family protein [Rhodococcus sp. BP-363]MBY6542222.1 nuclear transport factor 2 family protein [Rhodococcus sp. BP-369]MBY6561452.1 nuclear transport factor 2 family protein [Rhodococcus sp. BP-370]MBY6575744.1 nuclear transport factor 2 family protein [Rhodococcus sp. BP-364]MBY6585045.1 nuclear transport factor 2 family protein [Rho